MCVCLDLMGKCTLLLNLESGEWRTRFLDFGALGLISCFDVQLWSAVRNYGEIIAQLCLSPAPTNHIDCVCALG